MTKEDLYYLRSILGNLRSYRDLISHLSMPEPSLGGEILADNINWLDYFIELHERINKHEHHAEPSGDRV